MSKDPNDARTLLRRMRSGNFVQETTESDEPKKELTARDLLKLTRNFVNEDVENTTSLDNSDAQAADVDDGDNVKTYLDQGEEEQKLKNFFDDMNVHIDASPLVVQDNRVFWNVVIDGVIQFIITITDEDDTSGVKFNYLRDGYENSETTSEIVERVKSYYDTFYKFWQRNLPEN